MNRRLIWVAAALAVLSLVSCKNKEEKAFQREKKEIEKSISEEKSFILGTWVKDISGADSMPDIMVIKEDGKLSAYEDNDGGELGLDPEKEKKLTWKTDGDFFIINYGWETLKYYYQLEGKSITFSDEITKKTTAIYTKK